MPAPTPTPPLRYVSSRRLTSPLTSATSDATRSQVGVTDVLPMESSVPPLQTQAQTRQQQQDDQIQQLGAMAKLRYAHTLSGSEGHSDHPSAEEGSGKHGNGGGRDSSRAYGSPSASGAVASLLPVPPPQTPPAGSLMGVEHAAFNYSTGSNNHNNTRAKSSSTIHVPPAGTTSFNNYNNNTNYNNSGNPPTSIEDCHFTLHALRHENQILRQRIEVLTSTDIADDSPVADLANGSGSGPTREVPREVLLKRIARLEAALRLEALERDVVEQRLLAQERVLRAVCMPVPPSAQAKPSP